MEQHGQNGYPVPNYRNPQAMSTNSQGSAHHTRSQWQSYDGASMNSVSSGQNRRNTYPHSGSMNPPQAAAMPNGSLPGNMRHSPSNSYSAIPQQSSANYPTRYPAQGSFVGTDTSSDVSGARDARTHSTNSSVSYPGITTSGYGPGMAYNPLPPNQSASPLNPSNWSSMKQAPSMRPNPLQVGADKMGHKVIWNPRRPPNPFKKTFSPVAALIFFLFLASAGYYFYVRVRYSLDMGPQTWYGVLVLVVELIGLSSVIPYGMLLPFQTLSSGSKGLPIDDGKVILPPEKRFKVHILVPCYKEDLTVITNTVTAALAAEVPPGVQRTVYLCDDGKSEEKKDFIASLGPDAKYVTGRTRKPGEINGKSANVNNCLRNVIFPEYEGRPQDIPLRHCIVVFDADMAARKNFLLKILEAMWEDDVSLCLTPQAFNNINPNADIFNNINQQFWEYVLPGCDALGYIACTGTNFCLRARSLAMVGWFPEYTITEDYALSMELKMAGFKGRYLAEYLAVGEAPDEIRNVCRQRSRWTKGHMQIFFSKRCPLFHRKLKLVHKILYTNGTWAYFCTIITTLVFLFVPFNSLVFGYHPVAFSYEFALAATLYLPMNFLLMNYVRHPRHLKGQWLAQISNHILTFTYMKAVFNTLLSIFGFKAKAGFKATEKQGGPMAAPVAALKKLGSNIKNTMQRGAGGSLPVTGPLAAAAEPPRPVPVAAKVVVGADGVRKVLPPRPLTPAEQIQHKIKLEQQQKKKHKEKRGCWVWINAKTLEGALDPLWLAFSLCVSLAAVSAGIYTIVRSNTFDFTVNSWRDFQLVFSSGRLDVYLLIPILWALYNSIPSILFFVYFFTKGRILQGLCSVLQAFGLVLSLAAIAAVWLMVPNEYDLKGVLPSVTAYVDTARAGDLPSYIQKDYPWLQTPAELPTEELTGGYYMKGSDYVKYSLPIATSMTTLAWSLLEFPKGYAAAGVTNIAKDQLRHGAEYLIKAHRAEGEFVVRVGNPVDYLLNIAARNGSWGPPQEMPFNRTQFVIKQGASRGGADVTAAAAAALAATYEVFKSSDRAFADSALSHAKDLYDMATNLPSAPSCAEVPCFEGIRAGGYRWTAYISESVLDDMALAAAWLYKATKVERYSDDAEFHLGQHQQLERKITNGTVDPTNYIANYDRSGWAATLMLDGLLGRPSAPRQLLDFFSGWMKGKDLDKNNVLFVTPRGLNYLAGGPAGEEPLANAATAAVYALIYARSQVAQQRGLIPYIRTNMECFALQQVTYTLGGQMGHTPRSYVVGVGQRAPTRAQHRQASCPANGDRCTVDNGFLSRNANPNVIKGAVVAGPDGEDYFSDDRTSDQSKVSIAYNVPLMAAMAGLLHYDINPIQCRQGQGLFQSTFYPFTP